MALNELVVHVDDSSIARESLKGGLLLYGINLIAQASSVASLKQLLEAGTNATFFIIDNKMPNRGDGATAAEMVRKINSRAKIMSLSSDSDVTFGDYNLPKDVSLKEIAETIKNA